MTEMLLFVKPHCIKFQKNVTGTHNFDKALIILATV